jgi:hypothetical protein
LDSLEDKRFIPDDDWSYMSDEPTTLIKVLAPDTFCMVLPALQDGYMKEHANVRFADPVYAPSAELIDKMNSDDFDMYMTDLSTPALEAVNLGLVTNSDRNFMYEAKVQMIGSSDICEQIESGTSAKNLEPAKIVIGDPEKVFSAAFVNQMLNRKDLYSGASGQGGAYADSIADKIQIASTSEEIANLVVEGNNTVGFLMSYETMVFGFDSIYEVGRSMYRTVNFEAASIKGSANKMQAQDFVAYCATKSDAELIAARFGMTSS